MSDKAGLEPVVLDRVLQLQRAIQTVPDEVELMDMVARGLGQIPAVEACVTCFEGTVYWSDARPRHSCPGAARGHRWPEPGTCNDCPFLAEPAWRAFPLRTPHVDYGAVFLQARDDAALAPYLPFVSNTAALVALRLDHDRTAQELAALNRGLDEQVREHTRQLRESEALLARAQEIAHVGSWDLDAATRRLTWSNEVYRVFGLQPREFETSYDAFLSCVHPDDRAAVEDAYVSSVRDGRDSYDVEHRIVRRDTGEVRTVHERCVHVRDRDGRIVRSIGMVQDITDRRRAEEQRIALERQMQHAQKLESLGVLAGGIAHDFNNLLMAILGHADLALEAMPAGAPVRRHLEEIQAAARRAAGFARQMLAYSGRGRFVIETIDAGRLVQDMVEVLGAVTGKGVELDLRVAPGLASFSGDAGQIRQVIMNLVANASEAIGDWNGVVTLSTGVTHCDRSELDDGRRLLGILSGEPLPEGHYVFIDVSDTGCGMDAQTLDRIFEPFFTTKFTGRGLGMSAVLGIVRGHKGLIQIDSQLGRGTTVRVLLPALRDADVEEGAAPARGHGHDEWHGKGVVLLADDEQSVREIGRQMLERLGFRVIAANDGREALREYELHAREIGAVLLDLAMPHMDGEEALLAIRQIAPRVPAVLCSGYLGHDVLERAQRTGPTAFVQKPFSAAALRSALRELLKPQPRPGPDSPQAGGKAAPGAKADDPERS